MSEPSSFENNEAPSSSGWLGTLFGKTDTQTVTRNRSNCVSNTTVPTGNSWSKFRQFFNFTGLTSSTNTEDSFYYSGYVNQIDIHSSYAISNL
jgi:hypothetical protein